jgi:hypothetical protein
MSSTQSTVGRAVLPRIRAVTVAEFIATVVCAVVTDVLSY